MSRVLAASAFMAKTCSDDAAILLGARVRLA